MSDRRPQLTWEQALALRLHRQQLDQRRGTSTEEMASRLCGVHAQVLSCAELALAIRVAGATRDSVRADLWTHRTLVKTWAMRGTLHLLPSKDLARYLAALGTAASYWTADGVSVAEPDARLITEAIGDILPGRCLTRDELAAEIGSRLDRPDLADALRHGFGPLLKPAALAGRLCFGPSRGRHVTFMHPADWTTNDATPAPSTADATTSVLRDLLHGYGPTLPGDVHRWWGSIQGGAAASVRAALGDEVTDVDVDGRTCWMLTRDVAAVMDIPPSTAVRMLGGFDPYTVTLPRGVERLLPKPARALVYRTAGWLSPVVTAGACVVGTWRPGERAGSPISVELLRPLTRSETDELHDQAGLIGSLLRTSSALSIRQASY